MRYADMIIPDSYCAYINVRIKDGHPLWGCKPILLHRVVLYDKIGPGDHSCHWCGGAVSWGDGINGTKRATLVVDHIDSNTLNNNEDNLVPACYRCNSQRGNKLTVRDDELFVVKHYGKRKILGRQRASLMKCEACGKTVLKKKSILVCRGERRQGVYCCHTCQYDYKFGIRKDRRVINTFIDRVLDNKTISQMQFQSVEEAIANPFGPGLRLGDETRTRLAGIGYKWRQMAEGLVVGCRCVEYKNAHS